MVRAVRDSRGWPLPVSASRSIRNTHDQTRKCHEYGSQSRHSCDFPISLSVDLNRQFTAES
jgi:hypothetical protein